MTQVSVCQSQSKLQFSKRGGGGGGGLDRTSTFKGGDFFQGVQLLHKK